MLISIYKGIEDSVGVGSLDSMEGNVWVNSTVQQKICTTYLPFKKATQNN